MIRTKSTSTGPIAKRWIDGGAGNDPRARLAAGLLKEVSRPSPLSKARLDQIKAHLCGTDMGRTTGMLGRHPLPAAVAIFAVTAAGISSIKWLRHPRAPEKTRQSSVSTAPLTPPAAVPPLEMMHPVPAPSTPVQTQAPFSRRTVRRPTSAAAGSLDEQARLIGQALHLLRYERDVNGAIARLTEFDRRFPGGELAQEAHAALAEARLAKRRSTIAPAATPGP
jgi:hypothetical protein